jgi:thymidylate synthase (FAD)
MAFLSLRVDADEATFKTKPQWEIEVAALKMEEYLKALFPATWAAFDKNGRVSP